MTPRLRTVAQHAGNVAVIVGALWALQMPEEPEAATASAGFTVSVVLADSQITGCLNRSQVKSSNALVTVTCDSSQFVSISAVAVVPGASFVNPLLSAQSNGLMDGSRATLMAAAPSSNPAATAGSGALRRQAGTVIAARRTEPVVTNLPLAGSGSITSMRLNNATTELTPVDLVVTF